jgi:hypothetical protein
MQCFSDLFRQGQGVEWFEENSGHAKSGKAPFVHSLNLGGKEYDGDVNDRRNLLHLAKGGWTIDIRHHDIHQNGIRLLSFGNLDSLGARSSRKDLPTCGRFQRQRGYFADIILVVND